MEREARLTLLAERDVSFGAGRGELRIRVWGSEAAGPVLVRLVAETPARIGGTVTESIEVPAGALRAVGSALLLAAGELEIPLQSNHNRPKESAA